MNNTATNTATCPTVRKQIGKITKEKLNQDMENLAARLNGVEEFAGCTI